MRQRTKNIAATWLISVASILLATAIILMSVMFSVEPDSTTKEKYKELVGATLFNVTLIKSHSGSSCSDGCFYYPDYIFIMLNGSTCQIRDYRYGVTSADITKLNLNYSYSTVYQMFPFSQNGTIFCDPTVSEVYVTWIQMVISTAVFGGLAIFLTTIAVTCCLCGSRCERVCCQLDSEKKPLIKTVKTADRPVECDCCGLCGACAP